ncbi:MAG: transporter substrate-binding domain-containing protein [Desulfamplus sp.]|nr:transporter substrate-binding domain-containing protein [Desulfamplus sp.]
MKRIYAVLSLSVICLIISLIISPLVQKLQAQEIQVHVFNFQPFYVVEDGKEPSGIFVDYIKAIFERANIKYIVKGYPAKRAYKNLGEGKSNIFLGVKGVPELEGNVLYGNEKITQIDLRVYTRQETPVLKTKEELKGKKILIIRGYSYGGFIKYLEDPANKIELDITDGHELAFKKLQGKRADYLLDYSAPAETTLKSVIVPGVQNHSISILDIFMILSNKTPDAENLLKKLEQAFIDLKKEGKLTNL